MPATPQRGQRRDFTPANRTAYRIRLTGALEAVSLCIPELRPPQSNGHDSHMSPNPRTPTQKDNTSARPARKKPPVGNPAERTTTDEHEGATDEQVGDTTGPGVGYDQEPAQERDKGGVIPS